jgi:hypothetical protein
MHFFPIKKIDTSKKGTKNVLKDLLFDTHYVYNIIMTRVKPFYNMKK